VQCLRLQYFKGVYIIDKCWLVGGHLLFRDFEPYGLILKNVCVCGCACHGDASVRCLGL
jgi:hypothetical protein